MSIAHVEVISDIKEVIKAKNEAIEKAMIECGEFLEGKAIDEISKPKEHADGTVRPNVDTGRLRNSLTYATHTQHSSGRDAANFADYALLGEVPEGTVVIGTNVEYAAYVEMGTSRSKPYPYLRPALKDNLNTLKKIINDNLKS